MLGLVAQTKAAMPEVVAVAAEDPPTLAGVLPFKKSVHAIRSLSLRRCLTATKSTTEPSWHVLHFCKGSPSFTPVTATVSLIQAGKITPYQEVQLKEVPAAAKINLPLPYA